MLDCVVIASFKTDISLRIRFFLSLITWTLKVSSSSLKGKLFLLVSGSNSVHRFRYLWTELSSWVDWIERWYNSDSLGRDKHSRLLMILHFTNYFSIKLFSVSLKRSLQISLHSPVLKPLPCHISYFLVLMFLRTLLLVFQVLFHRTSQNLGNLP